MAQQRLFLGASFSGRVEPFVSPEPGLIRTRTRNRRCCPPNLSAEAQTNSEGGIGSMFKSFARQVQGAMPVVGLISRLAAPSGGIGSDELAYPEYARYVLENADASFNAALSEWERRFQQVGQRKYVLLFLWMARTGLGLVPTKKIGNAALRLRVTHDITIEMERFENERDAALQMYTYAQRPKGKSKEQIDIAVDALCRLSIGIKDGQPISEADQLLLIPIVVSAFNDVEGAADMVRAAVSDAGREGRKTANA